VYGSREKRGREAGFPRRREAEVLIGENFQEKMYFAIFPFFCCFFVFSPSLSSSPIKDPLPNFHAAKKNCKTTQKTHGNGELVFRLLFISKDLFGLSNDDKQS